MQRTPLQEVNYELSQAAATAQGHTGVESSNPPIKAEVASQALERCSAPPEALNAATADGAAVAPIPPPAGEASTAAATEAQLDEDDDEGEGDEEGDWRDMLWSALHAAAPPSRFACSGFLEQQAGFLAADVTVAGVGRLALPLCKEQAVTLKSVAEQAPHGKGLRTVVDTRIRDAFQVDASQVTIGPGWQPILQTVVSQSAAALDINDTAACIIEARLYKLLLYEEGGHFSAHQDTEKERGMKGTLVVQLPCCGGHTGGSLTVRHKGQHFEHKFAKDSASSLQYAAFFADCEHELSPVRSGMRLVLVYNLVWVGAAAPRLVGKSPAEVQLQRALRAWESNIQEGGSQKRIAFLLDHEYTEANLSFDHLKGSDRAMMRALAACRGFDAHLVLVTRHVSGGADYYDHRDRYHKRHRCYYDDEDEDEEESEEMDLSGHHGMTEVYDDRTTTGKWIAQDDSAINYGSINPEEDYYNPDGDELFGPDDDPDEEDYEGYTGNTGPTVDHIYRRALLVLWPRSQTIANAKRAGFAAVLSVLRLRLEEAGMYLSNSSSSSNLRQRAGAVDAAQGHGEVMSSSSAGGAAASDAMAALHACIQLIESPAAAPVQATWSNMWGVHNSSSSAPNKTAVLECAVTAAKLYIIGAVAAVQKLVSLTAESSDGLSNAALAAALAAAADVLDSAVIQPPLLQLVTRYMALQPASCIVLIQGVASHSALQEQQVTAATAAAPALMVDPLISLAAAAPALPESQRKIVAKLIGGLQGNQAAAAVHPVAASLHKLDQLPQLQQELTAAAVAAVVSLGPVNHLSSCIQLLKACQQQPELMEQLVQAIAGALRGSTLVWRVTTAAKLLPMLQNVPNLQQVVRTAIAEAIFSNRILLGNQDNDDMLQLSSLLLSDSQLSSAYYGQFAEAVAGRAHSYPLLKQLLQSAEVQSALTMPQVQQLVAAQIVKLKRMSAVPPFSWHMPQAKLPSHPEVESFLRGPNHTHTVRGFGGVALARKAAASIQGRRSGYYSYGSYGGNNDDNASTYSVTTTAAGTGKNAHVVVTKTRAWYERLVREKEVLKQELRAVQAMKRGDTISRPAGPSTEVIDLT